MSRARKHGKLDAELVALHDGLRRLALFAVDPRVSGKFTCLATAIDEARWTKGDLPERIENIADHLRDLAGAMREQLACSIESEATT